MNLPHDCREAASPHEWLKHAQSDIRLARLALDSDVLPEQICFHAQQAAEKALKAVLLYKRVDFPFTHDLDELVEVSLNAGITVTDELHDIGSLTPYAVQARYPGFWGEITHSDLDEALALAEGVLAWAILVIGARPDDPCGT
jgi:HEPN domain-containing protein